MTGSVESVKRPPQEATRPSSRILLRFAVLSAAELALAWLLAHRLIAWVGSAGAGLSDGHLMTGMGSGKAMSPHSMAKSATTVAFSVWIAVAICLAGCALIVVCRRRPPPPSADGSAAIGVAAVLCSLAALWLAIGQAVMSSHLAMMASLMISTAVAPALVIQALGLRVQSALAQQLRALPLTAAAGYAALVVCWHVPVLMDSLGDHRSLRLISLFVGFVLGLVLQALLQDRTRSTVALRRAAVLTAGVPSGLLGLALVLANKPTMAIHMGGWHAPLTDQRLGGLLMMIVDAVFLVPAWLATQRSQPRTAGNADDVPKRTPQLVEIGSHGYNC